MGSMESEPPRPKEESRPATAATGGNQAFPVGKLPPICGDFHIRIDRNGTWYYQNSPIGRLALAKLFSTVLRRDEDGQYWLTTPVENGRIEVEDVPFVAVELMSEGEGRGRTVRFRTNLDDIVMLGPEHPMRMAPVAGNAEPAAYDKGAESAPYITVRRNLEARLARPVYYHLVELSEPAPDDESVLGIWSSGHFYPIGRTGEASEA